MSHTATLNLILLVACLFGGALGVAIFERACRPRSD